MPTINNNRKILDTKQWEYMTPAPAVTAAGTMIASSRMFDQQQLYVSAVGVAHLYNPYEDGWVQVPNPGIVASGIAAGACAVGSVYSTATTGSSTAGTTTSMTTNLTLARDLRGYSVLMTAGPASGSVAQIARNTVGTNSVITFTTELSASIGVGSTYRLITPSYYVLGAGAPAATSFRRYDYALNTWSSLSSTGLPTVGTDGKLVSTNSWQGSGFNSFSTGSATAATTNTLADSTRAWTVNQWTNSQIRITAGTGAGQIRTISSNTSTQVTVSTNWTVTPDTTSEYSIEGNDDFIYYLGNGAVTMYRYSITANTWTTLAPTVARAAAPTVGMSAHWVWKASVADWNDDTSYLNGRFIYSFRGAGGALLDRYDIGLNAWSVVTYSPATEVFGTGSKYAYNGDYIYIQKDITGRWFRYNVVTHEQDGWGQFLFPNGAALLGDTAFDVTYTEGATSVSFVYMLLNTSSVLLRCMVI